MQITKEEKQKRNKKTKSLDQLQKYTLRKVQVMQDMRAEKHLVFVGGGVAHGPKGEVNYKKRKINKSEKRKAFSLNYRKK